MKQAIAHSLSHAGLLVAEAERSACWRVDLQYAHKTMTPWNNKEGKDGAADMTPLAREHKSAAGRRGTRQPLCKNHSEKSNTYHTCDLGAKKTVLL